MRPTDRPDLPEDLQLHVTSYTDMDMNDDDPQHIRDDHVDIIIGVVVAFTVLIIAILVFFWFVRRRRQQQIKRAMGEI